MELFTDRLRLTALREEDADALFGYRADPAVARYQGWCPSTRIEALEFIRAQCDGQHAQRGRWMQRAIRLSHDDSLIGDFGVHIPEDTEGSYEFGISMAPNHQCRGYARESLEAVFEFMFGTWRARRVHASIDPRNLASVALLRSLGMRQEAHFRESLKLRGEWVDDVIFALLAREWPSIRSDH